MTPKQLRQLADFVMSEMGSGHSERVYHRALKALVEKQGIPCRSEVDAPVMFMGEVVGVGRADLVIGTLAVELKVNKRPPEEASPQLRGYLDSLRQVERKACTGVVLNFGQAGQVSMLVIEPQEREVCSRFFRPRIAPPSPKRRRRGAY